MGCWRASASCCCWRWWRCWWMVSPSSLPRCRSASGFRRPHPQPLSLWERGARSHRPCVGKPETRLRVDLRPLEAAAVVDIDRLPLGEELQRAKASLAMAIARAARAAEGQLNLRANGPRVDIDDACRQVAHGRLRRVDVVGEDATR